MSQKKNIILLGIIGVLIAAALAALLIGRAGYGVDTRVVTTTAAAEKAADSVSSESTADASSDSQTQPTGQTVEAPTFEVEFGVGGKVDFDTTAQTQTGQTSQSTMPPVSSQPTQGQSTDGTPDAEKGENGMPDKLLTYDEFLALSNEDQQAYFFCFEDPLQYAQWLRQAQQGYEDGKTAIAVTGPVDLETLP